MIEVPQWVTIILGVVLFIITTIIVYKCAIKENDDE